MPCYHPLVAFDFGTLPSGKRNLKIYPNGTNHLEMMKKRWIPVTTDFHSPYAERYKEPFSPIPCGKCIGCKLEYSRVWANRCVMESKQHASSLFLTLTYDELSVPRVLYGERENGEAREAMSLRKADFQKFMKRLRRYVDYHICDTFAGLPITMVDDHPALRFFACGEYGPETLRPHYHALIFGLDFPDKKLRQNCLGNAYYTSKILAELWPYGHHIIGSVSFKSAAYVARYCTKKMTGEFAKDAYDFYGIEHPFLLMSRKPGIGSGYYEEFVKGKSPDERIIVSTPDGGLAFSWPKYFESKYAQECPEHFEDIKADRKKAQEDFEKISMSLTDLSMRELLNVKEESKKLSLKKLRRSL